VLTLVQGGSGFAEAADEWHLCGFRITLQVPGPGAGQILAQQLVCSGGVNTPGNPHQPIMSVQPLVRLNQANPTQTFPFGVFGAKSLQ
jgi:hypothetical protein